MSLAKGASFPRLGPLLGFSRALQATLSVAQPFLAALIALHGFPSAGHTLLGISAALAGFWAVFALNDLLDVGLDRVRFAHLRGYEGFDIDAAGARHPLARHQISPLLARAWIGALGAYACAAAYVLSPYAALLFLAAGAMEVIYCRLARITPWKFLVSGVMVGVGALAGWLAMSRELRVAEMGVLFVWMFAWEIGGRNIVNDFADVEEDVRLGVRTLPVRHGAHVAARLTNVFLVITFAAALALQPLSGLGHTYLLLAALTGAYLLLWPGLHLLARPTPQVAMQLFNRASLYPPAMLAVLIVAGYLP